MLGIHYVGLTLCEADQSEQALQGGGTMMKRLFLFFAITALAFYPMNSTARGFRARLPQGA
jgi:hypothetical protein